MSAILLPFTADRRIDWDGFAAYVARTAAAGITPAVNMDTGYVQLIDDSTRQQALSIARDTLGPGGELVAGACVVDAPGAAFDEESFGRQLEMIAADEPHPDSPRRPDSDRAIIATIPERVDRAPQAAA